MQENARDYELVVIARSQLDDQGLATLNDRIAGWITAAGGEVATVNIWGRRPLAYAIAKQTEGIYVQFDFRLPPQASREIERALRIEEQILRHLLVRTDEA